MSAYREAILKSFAEIEAAGRAFAKAHRRATSSASWIRAAPRTWR